MHTAPKTSDIIPRAYDRIRFARLISPRHGWSSLVKDLHNSITGRAIRLEPLTDNDTTAETAKIKKKKFMRFCQKTCFAR